MERNAQATILLEECIQMAVFHLEKITLELDMSMTSQEMHLYPQSHMHLGLLMKKLVYGILRFSIQMMVNYIHGTRKQLVGRNK